MRHSSSDYRQSVATFDQLARLALQSSEAEKLQEREVVSILVFDALAGSKSALEDLIKRYQERMAGFVYSLVGREDQIADLCNTVFLKMIDKLAQLREADSFESWLFRIAHNVCMDHLRRERLRRVFVPLEWQHEQIPGPLESPDPLDELREALLELPVRQRELLVLLQEHNWSYEELGRITGSTTSAVKSLLFRARTQLRRRLSHGA